MYGAGIAIMIISDNLTMASQTKEVNEPLSQ